ncbi:hypothetical protein JCM17380_44640 [Desulfosporosinus burensis]
MISFSGIDGSGKGTQISLVEEYYRANNIKFKTIWARGSWTPGIELIKKIVRRDRGFSEEKKAEYRKEARSDPKKQRIILILSILDLYWFFGIYYRLVEFSGRVVICDRYIWDTLVDLRVNFYNHNFESWYIWKLVIRLIPKPKHSFIFVISSEKSIERGLMKQEAFMESVEIKQAKIEEYFKLIDQGKWSNVIDGDMTIVDVSQKVKEGINE